MGDQQQQFVLALIGYVAQRGYPVERLCAATGIEINQLLQGTHPTITLGQMNHLWRNAATICEDELFGLHFGESLQLAALGIVGEIIKSSETVGGAIVTAAALTPAVTQLFSLSVSKEDNHFLVRISSQPFEADEFVRRQVADFLLVFTLHELKGLLLKSVRPMQVDYAFSKSPSKEYSRVLDCDNIRFGGAECAIRFDIKFWDQMIITANYELQKELLQKIQTQTKDDDPSFQVRILDYLMKNAYLGISSLEDVAANFNMTPRSVQRRLQAEAVTFQQLSDSVRKTLAMHYLESKRYPIKEISTMLGYNEITAFSRAFKRWTGKGPQEYIS